MDSQKLKNIVEAALLAAGNPLTIDQLKNLFGEQDQPERQEIRAALDALQADYAERSIEIREVASGFRVQVRESMAQWLGKLWEERPPRYSRALMETLAIVAYRQPVTRGDVEEIRGVSVTTNIIRTLQERDWIKVVGHRDVPGKPAMFGTTRQFLDYFGLKKLDDLPPLAELASMEPVEVQLELGTADQLPESEGGEQAGEEPVADAELTASAENEGEGGEAPGSEEGAAEENTDDEDFDSDEFDEEEAVSDEELAAAVAATEIDIDALRKGVLPGAQAESEDEEAGGQEEYWQKGLSEDAVSGSDQTGPDLPPGAVAPLVGLHPPGTELPEPATVSSLDDARAAAVAQKGEGADSRSEKDESAEVVPLKKS
jgi:segregation and condensation protein B